MKAKDRVGQKYGMLTIVGVAEKYKLKCVCDCGVQKNIPLRNITTGGTVSCGCLRTSKTIENKTTHGLSKHPLFRRWLGIKTRCYNSNVPSYRNYGARGIIMCDEWKNDFMAFYTWAIQNGWNKNLEIDRIDNQGNYEELNCRFVTRSFNNRNKRTNHFVEYLGETKTLIEWAEIFNIDNNVLLLRIKRGWDFERAIKEPKRISNNGKYLKNAAI